jgi:hypothetical protein
METKTEHCHEHLTEEDKIKKPNKHCSGNQSVIAGV